MVITNYLYGKRSNGFCTTCFHGPVVTLFAFPFHQPLLLKNHYNFFCVTKIWHAHKVSK